MRLIEVKYEYQVLPKNARTTIQSQTMGPNGKWTINAPVTINTPNDCFKGSRLLICEVQTTAKQLVERMTNYLVNMENAIRDTVRIKKLTEQIALDMTDEI